MNAPNPSATAVGAMAQESVRAVSPKPWAAVPAGLIGVRLAVLLARVTAMFGCCLPSSANDRGPRVGWAMPAF